MAAKRHNLLTHQSFAVVIRIVLLSYIFALPFYVHAATIDDFNSPLDTTIYRLATQKNDAAAQYLIGRKYLLGKNIEKNVTEGIRWLEMAANQNYKKAQYLLGKTYLYGEGVLRNYVYALDYLKRAAENNHIDAQYELGNYYVLDDTGNQQYSRAAIWYEKATQRQHKAAMLALAYLYLEGKGVKRDLARSKTLAQEAALSGIQEAKVFLSRLETSDAEHLTPERHQVTDDSTTAISVFSEHRAARNGDPEAQFKLAMAYLKGQGGATRDPVVARQWLSNAAQQEHGQAQYELGMMYRDGIGGEADQQRAKLWIERAAANGVTAANKILADFNPQVAATPVTTPPQDKDAIPKPSKTATYYEIGVMHLYGQGVVKDPQSAAKWFLKAAQSGNSDAQYELGEMYVTGNGVEKNLNAAKDWYKKAALAGSDKAKQRLTALGTALPSASTIIDASMTSAEPTLVAKLKQSTTIDSRSASSTSSQPPVNSQSAEQLLAESLRNLNNTDGKKDITKGLELLTRAAELDNLDAQLELARLYLKGKGVEINYGKAIQWYTRAAKQGDAQAQFRLGEMYKQGAGVTADNAEAIKWYRLAASQGHRDARSRLGGCRIC